MGKIAKIMNKKGIFFTFIAITLMVVFIIIFTPQADVSFQKDNQAVKKRIYSIDNYVNELETIYFSTVLRANAYKTILSLIFYINSTGSYLADLNAAFMEVSINGTINEVPIDSSINKKIMQNNTLTNWSNKIIQTAKDTLNVNTTIIIKNVSVFQTKPWEIDVALHINISVVSSTAQWRKEAIVTTSIPIEGLHDPYYIVNTYVPGLGGVYTNQIKQSSVEYGKWNLTQVREHLRNGTYVHWQDSDAPNFLMRFTNLLEPSPCCGIGSLVNPNKINPSDQIQSYVDYSFWSSAFSSQCNLLFNITKPPTEQGLWDEFPFLKVDVNNTVLYNITEEYAVGTC